MLRIVDLLLTVGAVEMPGECLVHQALSINAVDVSVALIQSGKMDIVSANRAGDAPIHVACKLGIVPAVDALLRAGVDPDTQNVHSHITPISYAVTNVTDIRVFRDILELLVNAGFDVNANSVDMGTLQTPFRRAVYARQCDYARFLIAHGADVNLGWIFSCPERFHLFMCQFGPEFLHAVLAAGLHITGGPQRVSGDFCSRFGQTHELEFANVLRRYCLVPRTLKSATGLLIRRVLLEQRSCLHSKIDRLELPEECKNFLKFKDHLPSID